MAGGPLGRVASLTPRLRDARPWRRRLRHSHTEIKIGRHAHASQEHAALFRSDAAVGVALGLSVLVAYLANGRSVGGGDVEPATVISVALARGDGPFLDRFSALLRDEAGRLPGHSEDSRGHAVSRYPVGPALMAAPVVWPQVRVLDWLRPGWERRGEAALKLCDRMAKNAAAVLTAGAVVVSWSVLRGMGLGRGTALVSALVAAFGSGYWPVASQALWQHGPAALCLAAAMWLLRGKTISRGRLALAGAFSAMLVACRPVDVVFSAAMGLWVLFHFPRRQRVAFFLPAIAGAIVLSGYNLYFFDTLTGGYARIEQMHPWAHGTRGTFTGSLVEGGLGTLLSPSHGLWVYWPWVCLATVSLAVAEVRGRLRADVSPSWWLSVSLVPYFGLVATYSCWWGGHSFGPRFWTDAVPIFVVWLGVSLEWALARRQRVWRTAFVVSVLVSVFVQMAGFLCYPSSWYGHPSNPDLDHARLWDWWDSELTRGLAEGVRPRQW